VSRVQAACRKSFEKQKTVCLYGPDSPAVAGQAWYLLVACKPQQSGTAVVLYAGPHAAVKGLFCRCRFSINHGEGHAAQHVCTIQDRLKVGTCMGNAL
jgi:hypothetical protein